MKIRPVAGALAALLLAGCAGMPPELAEVLGSAAGSAQPLGEQEIAQGLKEALAVGTERAVYRVGVVDGFWRNAQINIPLPEQLRKVEKALRNFGQGAKVDEFHLSLNRAAEAAAPEAADIFATAIRGMTLADARAILDGTDNAATEYFRGKTLPALTARFKPIVTKATASVGATRKYKDLAAKVSKVSSSFQLQDLDAYVTERALAGLFVTLADEELKIRRDPAARTTELLKRVFGSR
ncbi:MAG: DUF4197 domain-containing protein [Nevskiaceae bacterium]